MGGTCPLRPVLFSPGPHWWEEEGGTSPPAAQKAKCSADPSPHWPGGRGSEDIRSLLAPEVTWEELKVNWDHFFFLICRTGFNL